MVDRIGLSDDHIRSRWVPDRGKQDRTPCWFNELQHQLYNQMLHCQTNDEWYMVEELLENLRKYAVAAGMACDFGWAVHTSIRSLTKQ